MSREVNAAGGGPGADAPEVGDADTDTDPDADGVRMELWIRRPVCGPRTEVLDRLSALRSAGEIAAYDTKTWPDEVVVSEDTRHADVVDVCERFRAWAEGGSTPAALPFDRRKVTTLVGRTKEVLTLPAVCPAVYEGGPCGVYPCEVGDETWTAADYVDAYEAADGTPSLADLSASPPG